ncbi:MAG: outer membrane beta-barrel protein [Nevskiaceae bacterium]
MSILLRASILAGAMAAPLAASAATPTLKDVLGASGLSLTGYVDTGYTYMTAETGGSLRVFDTEQNSFNLDQVAAFLAYQPAEGAGVFVNLTAGDDADLISSNGSASGDNFDVTQAYAQYNTGWATLMAGKYVTLNGAEVIDSRGVPNASRGILFGYAIPFSHTGVRATFPLSDSISLIAGVNNGWDQMKDTNKQKTGEVGLSINAGAVSLFASAYAGNELGAGGTTNGLRTIADVVVTVKAGSALTFILNGDVGSQEDAIAAGTDAGWSGVAGYANVQFNPTWRGSLRAEYFDDEDGFRTGTTQKWKEVTLTVGHACSDNLDLLFEVRGDKSDVMAFTEDGGTPTDENSSVNVKALYKF